MAKKIADLSSDEDDGDNDKITMMNLVKEYLVPKEETYIVPFYHTLHVSSVNPHP